MRQWEEYERQVVPLDRRVYWFERVDGMPVVSTELQLRAAAALQTKIIQARQHSRFEIKNCFVITVASLLSVLEFSQQISFLLKIAFSIPEH